jgi:hypothetical protein
MAQDNGDASIVQTVKDLEHIKKQIHNLNLLKMDSSTEKSRSNDSNSDWNQSLKLSPARGQINRRSGAEELYEDLYACVDSQSDRSETTSKSG